MSIRPHPRVTVDGSSLASGQSSVWENRVLGTYNTMTLNRVGQLLIDELTRALRIVPYNGARRNATAGPVDGRAARPTGRRIYNCRDAMPRTDPHGNPLRGTGGGSDVTLRFTPSQWLTSGISQSRGNTIRAGARRDEVLFHEMLHAIRQMAGQMNCSTAAPGFDTKAEVWSIMATNVYSSAWNRPLRRDHHGTTTMTDREVATYYTRFETMIGHMCREFPRFTRGMSQVTHARFNPFREYYGNHP